LKPKDSAPAKRNPMRTSRTSIDLASDAAGRVDDAIEVPTCVDASSMDASSDGSTGLVATTTEENPASTTSKLGKTTCSNEYEDDFSISTGHDSKENEEKREVGTIFLKKRKSRATTRTPLTNEGMTTNELGYVAITKSAYNPKKELDMTPIGAMFGYKGAKSKRAKEFYKKLKTKVGDRARVRVLQEIVKNAQTNGYGWTCIDDIQDAWKEAQSKEDIETLASKIKKCIHSGYFEESEDMKKHWKFKMEKELMEEFKVVYVEGDKNKSLGCIAKLVSWARADVYKRIGRQGRRVHKH
jgi:hypothetical protein